MSRLVFFPGFNPRTDAGMFDHGADAIINTVNCKGTGKGSRGVAGQVFQRFPAAHEAYMSACRHSNPTYRLAPGKVLPVEINPKTGEREKGGGFFVLNAATKDDWRNPSKMEWVEAIGGKLEALADYTGARRLCVPPLGCGEGGLDWKRQVGPMLRPHLEGLAKRGVEVMVFAEDPAPERGGAVSIPPEQNRRVTSSGFVLLTQVEDWYAGIGARPRRADRPTGSPPDVLNTLVATGEGLARAGWGLRSGGAAGCDEAFERGARQAGRAGMQIFLPNDGFNGRTSNGREYLLSHDSALEAEAVGMVRDLHPRGDRLSGFALRAMARNCFQILGPDLESPSKAAVCYTDKGEIIGGTGFALRLCAQNDIPVINLGDPRWRKAGAADIVSGMNDIREGRDPRPPQRPLPHRGRDDER